MKSIGARAVSTVSANVTRHPRALCPDGGHSPQAIADEPQARGPAEGRWPASRETAKDEEASREAESLEAASPPSPACERGLHVCGLDPRIAQG
jgi:hypothetical protein